MQKPPVPAARHPGSRGFSLIELLVVVAVLATAAGLVIAKVDWVRRSADSATSLAGISQVNSNLQMFRTVKNVYPDRFDSLLAAPAVAGDQPTASYGKIFAHPVPTFQVSTIAAPPPGPPTGPVFSLQHAGIAALMDHNAVTAFPGDSGTVKRTLDFSVPTTLMTVVPGSKIETSIYPDGKPSDVTLVVLGVGPGCTANGVTMAAPPLCSAIDPSQYYPRFTAVFAAYANGRRADLKAVVDSVGQVSAQQMKNYYENTPQ